ncbi:MAG: hypothetical protein A2X49_01470 [Lentisphaerae bacterium GWF2_52_8]|nr:MAG: hypothetical protein A2X49_01470 [Lentisphaerae bacterium GWF2_52_8]
MLPGLLGVKFLTGKWSVFVSGAAVALLILLALYLLNTPVGMNDAYIALSKYCGKSLAKRAVAESSILNWQSGFLGGIFIGGLLAAIFGGDWKFRLSAPEVKGKGLIGAVGWTPLQGLAGGFLVMLGLQLAGDSFFGQWAAALQLSTGSLIFVAVSLLFATIATVVFTFFSGGGETGIGGGSGVAPKKLTKGRKSARK